MRSPLTATVALLLLLHLPAPAHRLDEYLQATIFTVEQDRVQASMRLVPGVAVSAAILAGIDTNGDGIISDSEGQAYASQVLRDLLLSVDGRVLQLHLLSTAFPKISEIKEGLGEIRLEFDAKLPPGGMHRRIVFANHHARFQSVYLVNCLMPRDHAIRILAQNRSENQSLYQVNYDQTSLHADALLPRYWSIFHALLESLGAFPSMFRLGMSHIASGTDHLLFLLVLLLPAPLLVSRSRWTAFAGIRHSFQQILRVVTAFTIGHSITLALAALGMVHAPTRPVEVLIAASILVSAAHAFRPLFPGGEAMVAAGFGLLHGLAFAATLQHLGLTWYQRVASILGFNLGIETMQLFIVAAVMPALVLLSQTSIYPVMRIGGALFAGFAAVGWMAERLLNLHNGVDSFVDTAAHQFFWIGLPSLLLFLALRRLFARRLRNNGGPILVSTKDAVHRV